jgi:enamine deaminase RidA (YjgF/YER057c/UK114 family)
MAASARTARDTTRRMERLRVSSGSPYEPVVGFSRAVRVGDRVFVAGTAPVMSDGGDPPADAYTQARRCLEIIADALAEAGARLTDVVRTRAYLVDPVHFDGYARAHGEAFSDIRPANTTVVAGLLDPRWLLEIEVEAVVQE